MNLWHVVKLIDAGILEDLKEGLDSSQTGYEDLNF